MLSDVSVFILLLLVPFLISGQDMSIWSAQCNCTGTVTSCVGAGLTYIPRIPSTTTKLIFTGNNLGSVTYQTFNSISTLNITTIKLDSCQILSISADAFTTLNSLRHLDLSRNIFNDVSEIFDSVLMTSLVSLTLASVDMQFLPNKTELCPKSLRHLDLSDNRIGTINNGTLRKGCPSLWTLTLNGNYLSYIDMNSLPASVRTLRMAKTKLCSGIPRFCSDGKAILPNLTDLDLSHNSFENIDVFRSDGKCLPNLQSLDLDGSAYVTLIPACSFHNLKNIRNISIREMSPRIRLEDMAITSATLQSLRMHTTARSSIDGYSAGVLKFFLQCPQLVSLSLGNLFLYSLNSSELIQLFSPLTSLRYLEIIDGGLYDIAFLEKLQAINHLVLRRNYISHWGSNTFANMIGLNYIDMSRNHITLIDKHAFPEQVWRHTTNIDLHGNPFDCSYELCEFRQWVSKNEKRLVRYPELYFCEAPDSLKGTLLSSWEPTTDECIKPEQVNNNYLMEVAITIGSVVLVSIVVGTILYRNRWNIKYHIYLMRSRRVYDKLPDGEEFIYDAFVAYHCKDRHWVITHLLPHLESQKKHRLCLHERDFLPGNFIVDNILNNIESSRKVIIVLSNDFARSEWCRFEATTAFNRVAKDGVSTVLLVLLEEISSPNVNSAIGNLLRTMTYIEWTNENTGRELFWSRLDDAFN